MLHQLKMLKAEIMLVDSLWLPTNGSASSIGQRTPTWRQSLESAFPGGAGERAKVTAPERREVTFVSAVDRGGRREYSRAIAQDSDFAEDAEDLVEDELESRVGWMTRLPRRPTHSTR